MASHREHIAALRSKRTDLARTQRDYIDGCQKRHPATPLTTTEQRFLDQIDAELDAVTEEIDRFDTNERNAESGARGRARLDRALAASEPAGPSIGSQLRDAIADVMDGRSSAVVELESRSQDEGGPAGHGVPQQLFAPVSTLRARSIVLSLPGILTPSMTSDRARFPRIGADTVVGLAESTSLTESDADVDAIDLLAQKFGVIKYLSTELVEDFEADALTVFGNNMLNALALKVDLGLLEGFGNNDLVGIRNTPGVNSTSVAGLPADFVKARTAEYELLLDNATPRAWVMHPRSWNILSNIKTGISGDITTVLSPDVTEGTGNTLLGYPVFQSTQITLTEGATHVGSWAALIDTSQLVVGIRRPAALEVSRDFRFDKDQIAVRATWRGALGVLNPQAISLLTDIRTS